MPDPLVLHGYSPSIYAWIARLTLAEKGLDWDWAEVDPFADPPPADNPHPFGRVPHLTHGDLRLYEASAIAQYVDEAFPGPALQPSDPVARARMRQAISIADSYAYWPMVRQVYVQKVFGGQGGQPPADPAEIKAGLRAARRALDALETIAEPDPAGLVAPAITLADLHLAPMIAAFAQAPEGAALLAGRPRLHAWFAAIQSRPAFRDTRPWTSRK